MDENKKPMRVQIDTNPETGEPVFAWVIKTGYDPQTGEEMFQTVEPTRYDTQTGEPIFDQLADNNPPNQENETGQNGFFNQTNETGQNNFSYQENGFENPGNETAQNAFANYGDFAYQSNPQMEMNNGTKKPKKSKGKKTIFIAAAIAIVALALLGSGAYALVKSGFFLDKYDKILYAAYTTAEDDRIFGNLMDTVQVLENRSIYVKGNMDTHIADTSAKGSVDLALDRSAFEYRADGSFSYNGVSFDGSAYLDREKVQVFCPDLADHIYQLSFDAPEDSFINQTMEENLQMNLKDVSRLIEKFIEQSKDSEQITKDMTKELRTRFKKMQLKENASKNSTSVSGSRTLKGYTLVITKDDFVDMLKIVLETSKRYQINCPWMIWKLLAWTWMPVI
ncbi:MAG: hypothetical protein IJ733_11545 [Lachnospiraceae bacterium]|nr:hypothetical protein [Lachnospiraceae bacterium]